MALGVLLGSGAASGQQIFGNGFEESCEIDADSDRLPNCEEAILGLDYFDSDTDDDGLSDGDEVIGTIGGLDFAAFGVDPRHKDLLIEMDWDVDSRHCALNHSHRPPDIAIAEIKIFYAASPVTNPDGIDGINFIADYGQGPAPFTGGNEVDFPDAVTTPLQQPFFDVKMANFNPNRVGYFRYQAHAHFYLDNDPSSGWGNIWGDNSIVSVNCYWDDLGIVRNTILHELGHNLGLQHGGSDFCNKRPNYNSLMNYNHQFSGIDTDCDSDGNGIDNLGYSVGDRTFLQQGQLDEAQGVCPLSNPLHRPIDWNGNGMIDALPVTYPGAFSTTIGCADIDTSSDHNDYAALQLKPTSPSNGGGAPTPGIDSGACPPIPEGL
jgi:hypothetical protein